MRRAGGAIAVWAAAAAGLAVLTAHVRDWFVMTDELLYERLALSVDQLHTPIPHVHGAAVANINQLYPLLLAPVLADGSIAEALRNAHVLNAVVMTSAAVPAYLLARRYVSDLWALVAAALCVSVPWLVLASFLLTGVVAYPLTVWALLAIVVAAERPSPRADVVALIVVAVATSARTQLVVLGVVLFVVALRDRTRHRTLFGVVAVAAAAMLVALAIGHSPLGTYATTAEGNPLPASTIGATFTHLASVALGVALLPFVAGGAWLVARARTEAFAFVGLSTVVLLAVEVASYDERFGAGIARDRYVSYLAPVLLIAFVIAVARRELRAWAAAVATAVLCLGLALAPLPVYDKLNVDAPVAVLNNYLYDQLGGLGGARAFLVAAALVAAGVLAFAWLLLPRRYIAAALVAPVLLLTLAETGYAFERLFRIDGTAGRPISRDPSPYLAWIDPLVHGSVAMAPFPVISGDYWSSAAYWWDVEFWNRRVDRSVGVPGTFEWTPSTFPKIAIRFDRLGRANVSPTPYVLQAVADTRFHLRGNVVINNRDAFLVEAEQPWRADWTTVGLYADGWTRPGATAYILVYPLPGQTGRSRRSLSVYVYAPAGVTERRVTVGSSQGVAGGDQVTIEATTCVPADRPARVPVSVIGVSPIPGDTSTDQTVQAPRSGGVQIARIYVSGDSGPPC